MRKKLDIELVDVIESVSPIPPPSFPRSKTIWKEDGYFPVPHAIFTECAGSKERLVLVALLAAANRYGRKSNGWFYFSDRQLARLCSGSFNTVRKAVDRLAQKGVVAIHVGTVQSPTQYKILLTTEGTPKPFDYQAYLSSPEWRARKEQKVKEQGGMWCSVCGEIGPTDLHHLTYDHLGKEPMNDLALLCRVCHEFVSKDGATNAPTRLQELVEKKRVERESSLLA